MADRETLGLEAGYEALSQRLVDLALEALGRDLKGDLSPERLDQARRQVREAGMKRSDIAAAIKAVRAD